ncbi:golvesin C-terminal-like domain-containing protein [Micromonospora purpureochromogenes]|uniref:golvesin C-terminal-like domain-containing protein n=1 Tax=Micromonospora purpureochromogenes TaxID=47872 RepID=UPI0012FE5C9B|nr:DNRLRE domain-containing protein [Micromonospora purpureochromogenes]
MLALVATLGGMETLRQYQPDPAATASAGDDDILTRLGKAARGLVGGGAAKAPAEAVRAGLYVEQKLPAGVRKKPAKRVKELTGRRSATTRVYKMSDGSLQAEVSATPQFYQDAKGTWQPIDSTVSPSKAGGFAAANTTNTFTSRFGDSTTALTRFELDGQQVTLGLAGAPRALKPVLNGHTVTYPGIAEGVDLAYDVTATSLKERLVLRAPSAAAAMTFTLDAGKLKVAQGKGGSIEFRSPVDNRVLLVMPAPFMYDAKADKSSPYGFAYSTKVTQTLRADGGRWAIDVAADKGWLGDPKRVYPVTVDPTIKVQPDSQAGQDAMVVSDGPSSNYGTGWNLSVGTTDLAAARSLVKFNLSSIPANTTIDSASLQMYYDTTHTTNAYDVPIEVREVITAWDESTVNWTQVKDAMGSGAATVEMVDDTDTAKVAAKGVWPLSTNSTLNKDAVKQTYLYNRDDIAGDTYTWVPAVPEDGTYTVEAHYLPANDRTDKAQYTVTHDGGVTTPKPVNQKLPANADWASLGQYPFRAGTTGRVMLSDANTNSTTSVIVDAVRLTKSGGLMRAKEANLWHSFAATNLVQKWVNSGGNNGFMVKAVDEARLGHGGPRYQAAENVYGGETENAPKLIINYGNPGLVVDTPRTLYPTGAALRWSAYGGADITEYQVHRSTTPNFTPTAATLVAPVSKAVTSFTDSTATPTGASSTDPYGQTYYYQVAVKTNGGTVVPSTAVTAKLPKSGQVVQTIQAAADVTLSSHPDKQTTNLNTLDGKTQLMAGNNSVDYNSARSLLRFDTSSIPANAKVLSGSLNLWGFSTVIGTSQQSTYSVHTLNKAFDPTAATWVKANSTTNWTTAGGDYSATAASSLANFGVDDAPQWRRWAVKDSVQNWVTNPTANKGFLVKYTDEAGRLKGHSLFASSEGTEALRPQLQVVYTQPDAVQTYYAPSTPSVMTSDGTYSIPVTLANPTATPWLKSEWALTYSWTLPNGDPVPTAGTPLKTALPVDVAPIGSPTGISSVDVTAQVKAPATSADGNRRNNYTLNWELKKTDGTKLTGIAPLPQDIAVEEPTSDQLGLEKYYSYAGKNTGAGGTLMNNLFAGNTVWSYNAFNNPSRGLSTFVRLAYNSLDTSDSVAGYGWSLQASSMMRLGTPLDFHPNPNPRKVTFTDGDGTSHRFMLNDATGEWISPKGVHLYLEKVTSLDCKPNTEEPKAWRLTKPDRTQFYYDCEGFLTSVVDNNENEMVFTYEERRSNNKPTKFLRYITDPAGRITLTIDYYAKGQDYTYIDDTDWLPRSGTNLTNPHIIDHVSQITDISGRKLTFAYTDKGLLAQLIDGVGSSGELGLEKKFQFRYDATQGNKNVKLVQVTDPRNHSTKLAYYYPQTGDDPKWHWRTKSYDDRHTDERLTTFTYADPDATDNILTTVRDAELRETKYLMDVFGRPIETTNAKQQKTTLGWDDDHNVTTLIEDNGATSTWVYDAKTGYPTLIKDAEAVANGTPGTELKYQFQLNGYVADLVEKLSPERRKWTFGYENDGDLSWVVDPKGNTTSDPEDYKTSYTYDAFGQMLTATDANGNTTRNDLFDANGYPQKIIDAKTKETTFVYDLRGQVTKVTDAYGKETTQTYDTFGRPRENRVPKDQNAGEFIVTPAPTYDANDNVLKSFAPNGAFTEAHYDAADQVEFTLAPVDEEGDPQRKTSFTYDKVGNLKTVTEPWGNLTPEVPGDYVTTNHYDEIYQLTSVVNAKSQTISYEYDNVGNVRKVVDPRKNATSATDDYTTVYEHDKAHRVKKVTDALGKFTSTTYDRDGVVRTTTDQLGNTTETIPDPRGMPEQVKVPHKNDNGTITYRITQYQYDEVGNRTKVTSPRGVNTPDDPDDFATVTVYDELNRVEETRTAYDEQDARYKTADVTTYEYDDVGRLKILSSPPSAGESVRNDTHYTYFDNGWTKTSRDPWDILTTYDYNKLGAQTERTLTPAGEDPDGGSSNRTMTWSYFPDGKLASRSDSGVPVGRHVVLVDNSDFNNVTTAGTWTAATSATGKVGPNYATRPAGTGTNTFTWKLNVPQAGTYEVFARYPQVSGAATNAKYTVSHGGGDTEKTVNQTTNTGTWVSLGSYSFTEGNTHKVSLSDQANGTVVADAVKLVRDNTGEVDDERVNYTYRYDPNGNLKRITDSSPNARVDTYSVDYTELNQVQTVTESKSETPTNTTTFTYNENSAPRTTSHERQYASYDYDERDLVSTVINGKSADDPDKKTTTFTYTDRAEKLKEVKGNGNTVDYTYYLDGLLKNQVEKKSNGTLVSEHTFTYDLNGNRTRDAAKKMNADNNAAYLNTTSDYTYDPRDRLAQLVRTGDGADTETYVHDANNNVISQTIKDATTTFNYDRNRLLTATTGGATASYNYDPFGRQDTVTAAGEVIERNVYDGFDHILENRKKSGTGTTVTEYTYDPLDRTTTKTTDAGGTKEKTTTFNYLGLSSEVLDEEVADELTKSYQYSPWGQRLSQVTHKDDGTEEEAYYGYNPHTDVEQLTDETGNTKATYGYTAYGKDNEAEFTGIDKPDAADPTKEPYNAYRFNAKRWDQASDSYDMGFRDYSPSLNRFLTRDNYNGAMAEFSLGLSPWTGNRYAFGGGNPISMIEVDGHRPCGDDACRLYENEAGQVVDLRSASQIPDEDELPDDGPSPKEMCGNASLDSCLVTLQQHEQDKRNLCKNMPPDRCLMALEADRNNPGYTPPGETWTLQPHPDIAGIRMYGLCVNGSVAGFLGAGEQACIVGDGQGVGWTYSLQGDVGPNAGFGVGISGVASDGAIHDQIGSSDYWQGSLGKVGNVQYSAGPGAWNQPVNTVSGGVGIGVGGGYTEGKSGTIGGRLFDWWWWD